MRILVQTIQRIGAIQLALIPFKLSVKLRRFEGTILLESWEVDLDEWEYTVGAQIGQNSFKRKWNVIKAIVFQVSVFYKESL